MGGLFGYFMPAREASESRVFDSEVRKNSLLIAIAIA
jgi:hypothetical protein